MEIQVATKMYCRCSLGYRPIIDPTMFGDSLQYSDKIH